MTVQYRPGGWCDVATASDGFWLTWADGAVVHWQSIRFDGTFGPERVQPAPEPLMFCRAASGDQDRVFSIHQGHDTGRAWLIGLGRVTDLGLTFGVQPVAIDQAYAYVVRNNQAYDRIRLDNGQSESIPHGVPGSSQGIRDVRDGIVIWADLTQVRDLPFAKLHQWSAAGDVVIGQADPPQIAGDVRGVPFTAIPGEAYEPHVVANGLSYAVCARTPQGAAFAILPPFPEFVSGAPAPEPKPVPVPVPHPTPEPKPMPFLPANIKAVRDRYVAKFPVPQGQGPEDFDPSTGGASGFFEDKARHWTLGLAEQIVFETGDSTWGVKNAGGGRPQSKDSIAQNGGRLINFDLLTGVGTGHPSLVPEPQGEDITGQTFMPVGAVNHLEAPTPTPVPEPTPTPTPVPTPAPTPAPSGMDDELRAFLTALVEANKDQATQIKGLRSDVKKASAALALLVTKKK